MTKLPNNPRIYHITHVGNLPSILTDGGLWSDAAMILRGRPAASIGMDGIKRRRMAFPLKCHEGDRVGDYVPFYFCPRSIMLYLIHCANDPELVYRGGQGPIVHLEANLYESVKWAEAEDRHWAFSLSNAGARYAQFRNRLNELGEVNWTAVEATDFRDTQIKEGKQAEFMVREFFPWYLFQRIGVQSVSIHSRVQGALAGSKHKPVVEILRKWYF